MVEKKKIVSGALDDIVIKVSRLDEPVHGHYHQQVARIINFTDDFTDLIHVTS